MTPKKKALIADDDRVTKLTLERLLQTLGFEVSSAKNGLDAWTIVTDEHPPLIIVDWVMPFIDGLELCRRIREIHDEFPITPYVIAVSSHDRSEDKIKFLTAGADDYVCKPIDRQEMVARVEAGWRRLKWEDEQLCNIKRACGNSTVQ